MTTTTGMRFMLLSQGIHRTGLATLAGALPAGELFLIPADAGQQ